MLYSTVYSTVATVLLQQYRCNSTVARVLLQQYCCNSTRSGPVNITSLSALKQESTRHLALKKIDQSLSEREEESPCRHQH